MRIVAAFKVVPDDQDIQVSADGTLDYSRAKGIVSTYDLNALEAAARLAAENEGSTVVAMSVGPAAINDSKTKKNVLARGMEELYLAADDAYTDMDARATAEALASLVAQTQGFDVIVCGGGSADVYAQQVDVQLAAKLGVPVVNGVTKIAAQGSSLLVERTLEDVVETVEVSLPCIVSVSPDIAIPRIPGMKDILAAGKKPMQVQGADAQIEASIQTVSCLAPKQADRKREIWDASADGAVGQFADALRAAR